MKTRHFAVGMVGALLLGATTVAFGAQITVAPPTPTVDLTNGSTALFSINPDYGDDGIVTNAATQPAGTGVFRPFLTINSPKNSAIESGYNNQSALYIDAQRPHWNTFIRLGDLETMTIGGLDYFVFELDANEPNQELRKTISIDNIRIYTSSTITTGLVGDNESLLDNLGDLRWALNDPLRYSNGEYNIDPWIKLDASQGDSGAKNGGSGISDMRLYVPVSSFADDADSDYVWFYNLNGVHYDTVLGTGAGAGFEEWRALIGPSSRNVPDGGATAVLLGLGLMAVAGIAHRRKSRVA